MDNKLMRWLAMVGLSLICGTAVAAMGGGGGGGGGGGMGCMMMGATPGSGIAGTFHDFVGGMGMGGMGGSSQPVGLCTFCHTPHKAKFTELLWNHKLSQNNFSWSNATSTTAGTPLPGYSGQTYGGASARCVSCHDGSVAIGDIYWFNGAPRLLNSMKMMGMFVVGAGGNLSGQHPHAIPYPFNQARNTYNGSTTSTALGLTGYVADPTKKNMRLYSDLGGNTFTAAITPGKVGMECTTCHDPHNKAAVDGCFLRGSLNSGASNYICNACHLI